MFLKVESRKSFYKKGETTPMHVELIFSAITAIATSITAISILFLELQREKKSFLDRMEKSIKEFYGFLKKHTKYRKNIGIGIHYVPAYAISFDYLNLSRIIQELDKYFLIKFYPYKSFYKKSREIL